MKSTDRQPLLPGSVLGVIGGGQLGRYFVIEARRLGYDTWVLDPSENSPAMQWSTHSLVAPYDDQKALATLAHECDAVTTEFENVPAASLEYLSQVVPVAPSAACVKIAQDRRLEKAHAIKHGIATVPYAVIESSEDFEKTLDTLELPAILKTATLGYDGKGQKTCHTIDELVTAFYDLNQVPCVLEQRVDLAAEISVVMARGAAGDTQVFPVAQNVHTNGILDTTTVPASVDQALQEEATSIAKRFAKGMDYQGVMALEFFVTTDQRLLFNEMAPRPHNSGHYTLDATVVSQFEQQVRALCGVPLGDASLVSPVCMLNLLGDSWAGSTSGANPGTADFASVLATSNAKLHLYGKAQARPGRKMGHINCLAQTPADALTAALALRQALRP
ncbi:MAG: 5-(carboxyamino)imidazole ribonucleotide synthase [Gammaproteobacteria bacterium]|nr:5-(carboxyamino)imidazole ribonucleotide synthase [Gammaproteobacteria bacterium]